MKKLLSILLVVGIAASLAACSSNAGADETTTAAAGESTTATQETTIDYSLKSDQEKATILVSLYTNEELGIDVDRDAENFAFTVSEDTVAEMPGYRVEAAYIGDDGVRDVKGSFFVYDDLHAVLKQDLTTHEYTELPAKSLQ